MKIRNILVTGGAGFIGSHLIEYLLKVYENYNIINLDALTYASDLNRLKKFANDRRYRFILGNICNAHLVQKIFQDNEIDGVFHLAAESHVDNSINNPKIFVETNINGTFTLLETARNYWQNKHIENPKFLHVSTDEVFGSLGAEGYFTESSPYAPNSPYSASKAASDFLARSYFHTYRLPVIISNCSNNYGPKQHDEKLIPTIVKNALAGQKIPIYGEGKNIRDWLYVTDHCNALDKIFHSGKIGENYNIGTNNEKNNLDIVNHICKILDRLRPLGPSSYKDQISFVSDRPGHDFRYAIDNSKIKIELNWNSTSTFESSLEETVKWYIAHYEEQ